MPLTRHVLTAICGFGLLACTSQTTGPHFDGPLAGTFTWVRSEGGIAFHRRTPASEGYQVTLIFDDDSVRAFRNKVLVAAARFTIREDSLRMSPAPVYIVRYDPPLSALPFDQFDEHSVHITPDTLYLADPCCDRYTHVFVISSH